MAYRRPARLAKMFDMSRSTVYDYIKFIKKNMGKGKRYPADIPIIEGSSGQLILLSVFFDAYRWKKFVEMGVAPPYDSRAADKYELYLGGPENNE